MKSTVRKPQQERSIEKKNKIIEAGYELFSEVGYYGTNTAEIAKRAGVSTGIVYGYFQDKRDILICVLEIYINKVFDPILKTFDKLTAPVDFDKIIPQVIDLTIKTHKKHAKMHEVLHSLASTDEAVNSQFIALEDSITVKIADKLSALGENIENAMEKIHFAMDIIQSFSHEYIFDKHDYIDYFILREMVNDTIINLFKK
jgi:AcrR family transcriptional regulator